MESGLLVLAAVYAGVCGANDGGALAGVAVRGGRTVPLVAIGTLTGAVVVVPLAFGAPVARTLAVDLVGFSGDAGATALAVAVLVALLVTAACTALRLPTSLTLATVGAIVGVGLGADLPVDGATLTRVLVLATVAPVAGAGLALGLLRAARLPGIVRQGRRAVRARPVASLLVALAYGANDGQKMIAVAVVATGAGATAAARPGAPMLFGLAGAFGLGAVVGLRRAGATLGSDVLAARPLHLAVGEASASVAVAASGAVGAPVSMTQAVAGAVAGAGAADGPRRVRWRVAARLVSAWIVTLPAAMLVAALGGRLL